LTGGGERKKERKKKLRGNKTESRAARG
jgi:hypothetical protein